MVSETIQVGAAQVSRLGFGTMRTVGEGVWGWPSDRADMVTLLQHAAGLGINFFDTADAYGPETSEYLLRDALHPYDGLVIATKGGYQRSGPGEWHFNGRPSYLRIACENSLRRLEIDSIALYQLHDVDSNVPFEDSVGTLRDLQKEGKIRDIGLSNVTAEQLDRGLKEVTVVSVQNRFNLTDRGHQAVLDLCTERGIAFIPWYPLATGDLATHAALKAIGEKHECTPSQVALAWLLAYSPVTLPIPGTSKIAHLEQNWAARRVVLDSDDMQSLADITS